MKTAGLKFSITLSLALFLHLNAFSFDVIPGAERGLMYLPLLKGKQIAVVANQASMVKDIHLIDFLDANNIAVKKIFTLEHGFYLDKDAGQPVNKEFYSKGSIPILPLYGQNCKLSKKDVEDITYIIFDIQDVGVRFYTYISSLHYIMHACAEFGKLLIILDRPNPNVLFIDGPVLKPEFRSFVGMHPVPVLYGMTIGEYAMMINGEGWLEKHTACRLKIIPCGNYSHDRQYSLPVRPSPNLPNDRAVRLYPSLCFFEGTVISVGRGTEVPFQVFGHPDYVNAGLSFSFIPKPGTGSWKPLYNGKTCYGLDLSKPANQARKEDGLTLQYLIMAYTLFPDKKSFFRYNNFFDLLAGTDELRKQIIDNVPEAVIRETWSGDLIKFKKMSRKYLIYN